MSRVGLAVALLVAILLGLTTWVVGVLWTLVGLLVTIVVVVLLTLFVTRTPPGRKVGRALGLRVGRTRVGKRMASASMRTQAERRGIRMVDAAGRPLSDVELQLELADTPEARAIKRQLRGMNPQQRAQALRMMAAQMESAASGNPLPPPPAQPPFGRPGRQGGRPPGRSGSGGRRPRKRR